MHLSNGMVPDNQKIMSVVAICYFAYGQKRRKESGQGHYRPIRLIQTKCKALKRVVKGKAIRSEGTMKMKYNLSLLHIVKY